MGTMNPQQFVAMLIAARVDASNQLEALQQLQGSVDCRDIHGGVLDMNATIDLFHSGRASGAVPERSSHKPL